jgi:hypothetical protein
MGDVVLWTIRAAAAAVGIGLLYAAAFLYETEESRIHNRLEELWIAIDDLQKTVRSREVALATIIATRLSTWIDRFYGSRAFSARMMLFSAWGALVGVTAWVIYFAFSFAGSSGLSTAGLIIAALLFVALAPAVWPSRWWSAIHACGLLVFLMWVAEQGNNTENVVAYLAIFSLAIAGNALFLLLTRTTLRRLTSSPTPHRSILLLTTSAAFLALVFVAFLSSESIERLLPESLRRFELDIYLAFLPYALLPSLMIGAMFVMFGALLLAHRLVWPLLNRPLYALVRHRIVGRKPTLVALGTVLIGWAWPPAGLVVKNVVSWFS